MKKFTIITVLFVFVSTLVSCSADDIDTMAEPEANELINTVPRNDTVKDKDWDTIKINIIVKK